MYSYENIKIRNKRIKKDKKYKLIKKTLAVTGAIIIAAGAGTSILINSGALEPTPKTIISNYYGEDSKEYDVVSYIELSKEIEKLNLEKYDIAPNLYERYNISKDLKNPEEIRNLIFNAKNINAFVSTKNITKQSENIEIILNLNIQKELVNDYIYKIGYDVALNNIEQELKDYAGEVFGVEGDNLDFSYKFDNKSGDSVTSVKNGDDRYNTGIFLNDTEKNIKEGVIALDEIKDSYKTYTTEYNKEINDSILNALKVSAQLSEENDNNDLFNEKMASKLR